ncbi:hypothetical protein BC833DRAFT_563077 [Globomyces pollinis-pini]|nr:hypothetical protein BC833DRAFT_563077 [Globomyces pollinis-pini]KAJ2997011.1 hypothetical protein HDV02_005955 [Globomyces sp. JEL0801]
MSGLTMVMLDITFATLGSVGAIWVIRQFVTGKQMLQNLPGLLITTIACTDLVNCLPYYIDFLSRTGWIRQVFTYLNTDFWFLFSWATLTCCLLGIALAFNTLLILKYHATIQGLEKWKWVVVLSMVLLPILIYFLPLRMAFMTPIFNDSQLIRTCHASAFICTVADHLLFIFICFTMLTCIGAYLTIYYTLQKSHQDIRARDQSIYSLRKLIMIYCIFEIITWAPWIIQYIIMYWGPIKWAIPAFISDYVTTPSRGYIHALGVVCANRALSRAKRPWYTIFWFDVGRPKDVETLDSQSDTPTPVFDFTFDDNDYFESKGTVSKLDSMVSKI